MDFIFTSIYAGLLPQISHLLIVNLWNALFSQKESQLIFFFTLFTEVLLLLISLGLFYYYLTEDKKEIIKNKVKLIYQNMKEKVFNIISYLKKRWQSQKLIEKGLKLDVNFQKKLQEIKPGSLKHLFISVKRDSDGFISSKKNLDLDASKDPFKSKNSSVKTENDIPINTSSTMDIKTVDKRETTSQDFSQKVDIDLSKVPIFSTNDGLEKNQNAESEDSEKNSLSIRTIDPEKTPSVFNDQFKQSNHQALADISLLSEAQINIKNHDLEDSIRKTAKKLEETIKEFGITTKVIRVSTGPVITQYELTVEAGVKISKIVNLSDNIALSLAASSVRIVAPIPGKGVIGIEIPNKDRKMVVLREVIESQNFNQSEDVLPLALGKSIMGESVVTDMSTTPHLLIAGATGAGKSVCVNGIILSLIFKRTPAEIRFLMIDPKMVELNIYNGIPHLLAPVITEPKKASLALRWVIAEMESRYYLLEKFKARSISSFNVIIKSKKEKNISLEEGIGTLPYIVVIIDEFADLMMIARKEIEDSVSRLAAMSRAVGIHLILATQRPSVDVITGVIKANFPSRIAFQVSSKIDSRTIMDNSGADQLLGKGDMLFSNSTTPVPERIQGAFISDAEVNNIVEDLKTRYEVNYLEDIFAIGENTDKSDPNEIKDELFEEAVQIVLHNKKASASYLQRKLKIGYNRAARIVELMEEIGVVGPADGSKPREVLVSHWP